MKISKFDILWVVFFSAFATGFLSSLVDVSSILIGLIVGIFGTVVCYFNLRNYERVGKKED